MQVAIMGNKPYAEPLGENTMIGRVMLHGFGVECTGGRMLSGEILIRRDKVKGTSIQNDLGTGITIKARVESQNKLLCKKPHGVYTAEIQMDPYDEDMLARATSTIKGMDSWQELILSKPSILGTPTLELKQFWRVSHDMLEELVRNNVLPTSFEASCDCQDRLDGNWCKHIAALSYELINLGQTKPLEFMLGLGLDIRGLLVTQQRPMPTAKRVSCGRGLSTPVTKKKIKLEKGVPKSLPSNSTVVLLDCGMGDSVDDPIELD